MPKTELDELDALALMRQRFRDAEEAETLNRISAEDALRFYWGDQWADDVERERKADGRPCFTLNKLPSILKQVLNENRTNKPAIQVDPVSDGASEDTADAMQALTRHVEDQKEGAQVAYETAFEYMTIGGFASWRVQHDYLPKSFDQDLFIGRIANPFSIYWDPAAQMLDKSDAAYCFVVKDMGHDAFDVEFPDSEIVGQQHFEGIGDQAPGWVSRLGVRVAEYFTVESEKVTLVQLSDGKTSYDDEIPKGAKVAKGDDGKPISRPDIRRKAFAVITNGVEWLGEKKQLPTDDIPVVSIFADQLMIDGEVRVKGLVEDLMQPAKLFNYNSSAIGETMALGTKASWVATVEQIEPYMALWRASNQRNIAVLPYKNIAGVNPPNKISNEPPIEAMSAARLQSADDLRSISGVYDATQAPNGGEESGKAILARRHQSSTGNANFSGNLARGIKRTAQILVKYFPKIYDTARVMRITGGDQQPKQVIVHAGQPPNAIAPLQTDGIKGVFDLSVGIYDIRVTTGKTDETKRQESVEMLLTLCSANPAIVPIIGDLVVNEMDFAGKKAIVARMQKALPPGLQDNQNPTDPGQLQAHNTQLMQANQQLMQQVQQLTQEAQTEAIKQQGRQAIANTNLQATSVASDAKVEAAKVAAQVSILKEAAGKSFDAVHDHAMADKAHIHQTMQADHAHDLLPPPEVEAPLPKTA